jgi:hypothetical protein
VSVFNLYSVSLLTSILDSFVDRDMIMRFLWGLGVGHIYANPQAAHSKSNVEFKTTSSDKDNDLDNSYVVDTDIPVEMMIDRQDQEQHEGDPLDVEDPEQSLEDCELEEWWVDEEEMEEDEFMNVDDDADDTVEPSELDYYE